MWFCEAWASLVVLALFSQRPEYWTCTDMLDGLAQLGAVSGPNGPRSTSSTSLGRGRVQARVIVMMSFYEPTFAYDVRRTAEGKNEAESRHG